MSKKTRGSFAQAAKILKSLAHPLRLEIVCGLRGDPCTQTFIAEKLGIPQSTVAQHLKVLRESGVVKSERKGLQVILKIGDPSVEQVMDVLCRKKEKTAKAAYSWDEIARSEDERRMAGSW